MATTRAKNSTTADETTKNQQEGKNESTPRKTNRSKTSAKSTTTRAKSTSTTGTKSTGTKAKSTKAKSTTSTRAKSTKSGTSTSRASTAKSKANENPIQAVVSDIREEAERIGDGIERTWREEISVAGNQLVDRVKDLAQDGAALRLRVKHDGKVLVEIPLAAAVAGGAITVLAAPILAAIAAIGGAVAHVTLEVERKGSRSKASSKK